MSNHRHTHRPGSRQTSVILVVAALALGACGSDDGDDATEPTAESTDDATDAGTTPDNTEPSESSESSQTGSADTGSEGSATAGVSTFGQAKGPIESITWALPYGEPNTINPPNTAYYSSALIAMQMCEPLTRLNPDYSTSPNLADLSQPDELTLVYTIRDDVTFWDGTPLTADDVAWSLNYARSPEVLVSFLYVNVASIEATGPLEVTIKLNQPDSLLPYELATFAGTIMQKAFSEAAGEALGTSDTGVMCTGPLQFDAWTPGQGLTLVKNDNYWDPTRAPNVGRVEFNFTTDSSAIAQALTTGELDGGYEIPASIIPTLQSSPSGSLVFGDPTQLFLSLPTLRTDGALSSPDIRKAFYSTIDQPGLAEVVYQGAAEPNYTQINRDSWDNEAWSAESKAVFQAAYDAFERDRSSWGSAEAIDAAKGLADQAGYGGETVVIGTLAGDATLSQAAQLIQANANLAGFDGRDQAAATDRLLQRLRRPGSREGLDTILVVSFNGVPNPIELIQFNVLPGSFYNYTGYDNPEVTELVNTAWQSSDQVEQATALTAAQAIYEEEYISMALVQLSEIMFLNNRLSGATTSFAYLFSPSIAGIGSAE